MAPSVCSALSPRGRISPTNSTSIASCAGGNDYFLQIQDPAGFLYHGIRTRLGDTHFMDCDWWDSNDYQLFTRPAALLLQHNFIATQASAAQLFRERDPGYAHRCMEAGKRCFDWTEGPEGAPSAERSSYDLGSGMSAAVQLFRATGEKRFLDAARGMADQLLSLQAPEGHFQEFPEPQTEQGKSPLSAQRACNAHQPVLGLIDCARWLEGDKDHHRWIAALQRFADGYAKHFAEANAFGVLPNRAFNGEPRQQSREWCGGHYRYFLETNYWNGLFYWNSGDIAVRCGYGTCLVYLAELLGEPWLRKLAHRHLDWALGVNPFDSSMIFGIGRNQSPTYPSLEMIPPVPDIEGAVFQGILGDEDDIPLLVPGCYITGEFWMPHQASLLWLMAELSRG